MSPTNASLGITVLGSGSKGNSMVIQAADEALLLDAGFSARELRRRMQLAGCDETLIKAILVSHEHSDHACGVRVTAQQLGIPIYSNRETADVLRARDSKLGQLHIFAPGSPFEIGDFRIEPFSIPHDANNPVGFVIRRHDRKIGIATDLGHASHLVCYQLQKCDLLIIESNHDLGMLRASTRPWSLKQRIMSRHGHLSNAASMELLTRVLHAQTRHLIFAHASEECNDYDIVKQQARQCLAELKRDDITPLIAKQDEILETVWL